MLYLYTDCIVDDYSIYIECYNLLMLYLYTGSLLTSNKGTVYTRLFLPSHTGSHHMDTDTCYVLTRPPQAVTTWTQTLAMF